MESVTETNNGTIKIITFNKPTRKNAIDFDMYVRVTKILEDAAKDDGITIVVLTGTGDFYTSGNDVTAVLNNPKGYDPLTVLRDFINAFVTFPKILIAIVNGPAIGIGSTMLGLCDLVFSAEHTYFYTPFSKLGIVAEACSSYTFPKLMGTRKATEMLLFNHKMSAKEALDSGLINYIYKPEQIENQVWSKIYEISKLSKQSMFAIKRLLKGVHEGDLIKTNMKELEELEKILSSEEYMENVFKFASSRRNKSKL